MLLYIPMLLFVGIIQFIIWILPEWQLPAAAISALDWIIGPIFTIATIFPPVLTFCQIVIVLIGFEFVYLITRLVLNLIALLRGSGEIKI